MCKKEFCEHIKSDVQNMLIGNGIEEQLVLKDVTKKNDLILAGITFESLKTMQSPGFK